MKAEIKSNKKLVYIILLTLFSTGTFGLVSDMEIGFFLKAYGLAVFLLAGLAFIYFGFYRRS